MRHVSEVAISRAQPLRYASEGFARGAFKLYGVVFQILLIMMSSVSSYPPRLLPLYAHHVAPQPLTHARLVVSDDLSWIGPVNESCVRGAC